jgi:glutamate dehydrogenase
MAAAIEHFRPKVAALAKLRAQMQDDGERARIGSAVAKYVDRGVSQELASAVVSFDTLYAALDIIEVADGASRAPESVAELYFELSNKLGLPWLRDRMAALPDGAHWQMLAKEAMQDDLSGLQRTITGDVLAGSPATAARATLVAAWQDRNRRGIERAAQLLTELRSAGSVDAAMLSVTLRELRGLA